MTKKTDSLLREAVAEAKQVKQAAVANAKIALEEAFKPHLASMLTAKLRNEMEDHTKGDGYGKEDGGDTDDLAIEGVDPSSSDIGSGDNKGPSKDAWSSSNVPNPKQEIEAMGKGDAKAPIGNGAKNEVKDGAVAPGDAHEKVLNNLEEDDVVDLDSDDDDDMGAGHAGIAALDQEPEGGEFGGEFGGEEQPGHEEGGLDLEALIRELEADVLGMDPAAGAEGGAEMGHAPEEESIVGIPQQGMQREDVSAFAKRTPQDTAVEFGKGGEKPPAGEKQELKLSEKKKFEYEKDPKGKEPDDTNEEISLDELLSEIENDVMQQHDSPVNDVNHYLEVEALQNENTELKNSLKEHRDVVRFLKDRINEINMLNAKLLFTNKLFKQYNLNSGQKMHVVETFDRATTLREVKLIFTTLAEAYSGKTSKVGSKSTTRQITEGLASKTSGSTKPKSPQVLVESAEDALAVRFRKLAGIKVLES